jgi:cellulose synthase operon protein C
MRLADVIGGWIGKVEIVLAGADEDLREGQEALALGDPMRARAAARRVLSRAPDSPIGLALLADACDAGHLDAELALTLEELARRAPSRGEVWVRLGRARRTTGAPEDDLRDAFVRALAVSEGGSEERREALIELADLDLARGDAARAELWLERAADDKALDVLARRAEVRLLRGDAVGAKALLDRIDAPVTDGHAALARGRALSMLGDAAAFVPLVRAMVLDAPGASEALSSALAHLASDPQTRTRVRSVVDAKGEQGLARWRAAFARAEGARDAARRALSDAVRAADAAAVRPLLDAAIDDQDSDALALALRAVPREETDPLVLDARSIASGTLDDVASVRQPPVIPWAIAIVARIARAWVPAQGTANWPALLQRLDVHARALADLESVAAVADLSAERSRPVRLAIVGEFNAGKSTFINALIGADIAPTGVLPTTASLHHLRWAPDRYARVSFAVGHEPPERIVTLDDLRPTLKTLDATSIRRVELLMPLPFLLRVEILDTPGFNAPDARHTLVARSAFEEADAALWVLDATQALKQSERAILEEARRAKIPVLMLVNKADRLTVEEVSQVLTAVVEALAETGLPSLAPPLAFSARKALAGKLGDARALEESGWGPAQSLLDERIVARSDELKERSLRRRALRIVTRLASQAEAGAARQRTEDQAAAAQARAVGQAAARVERDAEAIATHLAKSLEQVTQAWASDLELVFVGRDRSSAEADPVLARYRVDRAVASLAPPLSRALASLVLDSLSPAELAPFARSLVRAAASSSRPEPEALLPPLARAAVATLVEQLFARSVATPRASQAEGLLRELDAIRAALG